MRTRGIAQTMRVNLLAPVHEKILANELSLCAERGARVVAVQRLDVNGLIPTGANDLSQSLGVVLVRHVDLHFAGGARMPGIKTNDCEPELAELVHEPWSCRSGLDPNVDVISPHAGAPCNESLLEPTGTAATVSSPPCRRCK